MQYTREVFVFREHTLSGLLRSHHVYGVESYTTSHSHTPEAIAINYQGI